MVLGAAEQPQYPLASRFPGASRAVGRGRKCTGTGMPHLRLAFLSPYNFVRACSIYGSGYPGVLVPYGVAHLGFPFYFWPVVWYGIAIGASAYLFDSAEVHFYYCKLRCAISITC
jgi:hypothetical protein